MRGRGFPAGRRLRAAMRGAHRRLASVPHTATICAAIACVNAVCWSILVPPFQAPDEPSHFAYTQQLAEGARLPTAGPSSYSEQEQVILADLHHAGVRGHPGVDPISSATEQRQLERDLGRALSRRGDGKAGVSASEPPLYYLLELAPYGLGLMGTMLDQLELMRLLSAIMGGLSAFLAFLFVREALPRVKWAWTVGGLGVALLPLLGFIAGAVNPDSMLAAVSAAIFFCLARAFRRGLTRGLAVAIGTLVAVGFLTKLNFIGLAPGVLVGLILLTVRAARTSGRAAALRSLAIAIGISASPACLYLILNLLSRHPGPGIVASAAERGFAPHSLWREIGFIWQLYLPRVPGMTTNPFSGLSTTRDLWFDRSVGLFGWLDTSFPVWAENVALVPAALLSALCLTGLVRSRDALRVRVGELCVYALMGIGTMLLVGADTYLNFASEGAGYVEPRYFLPLLPLLAVLLALAARGAGRRWGPTTGAVIVVLFVSYDLFSELLVVARYYG